MRSGRCCRVLQNSAVAPDEALAALGTTQQNACRYADQRMRHDKEHGELKARPTVAPRDTTAIALAESLCTPERLTKMGPAAGLAAPQPAVIAKTSAQPGLRHELSLPELDSARPSARTRARRVVSSSMSRRGGRRADTAARPLARHFAAPHRRRVDASRI